MKTGLMVYLDTSVSLTLSDFPMNPWGYDYKYRVGGKSFSQNFFAVMSDRLL